MQIFSRYTSRSRNSGITFLLLWAFTLQWIVPFDIVAKEMATITRGLPSATLPEIQSEFIRQIPLIANDVVYSPLSGKLYVSVPSSAGTGGNSIATIDPLTGVVTNSVFIGSEPNKLALSDDGHTLYVSLEGSFSIRRFDTTTQTAGAEFPLGQDGSFGLYSLSDLAVAPGNPNLVAVARSYRGVSPPEAGVAVFDNGVQRTQTGPGHISGSDYLAFSASASTLYGTGFYSGLSTLTIDANGVTLGSTTSLSTGARIKFDNGRIYGGTGQVINPASGTLLGTFSGAVSSAFVPDSTVGRAYYLVLEQGIRTLKAFDINTFLSVGSATLPNTASDATAMVRWGSNGLAFRTSTSQLFLVQTSLIPSADPIPTPTPTPSPTPTPTPVNSFIRQIQLATNDLVFNPTTQSLMASVPSSAGSTGNSVASIDPVAGTIIGSTFIGSEPNKIALSSDGQTLWVGLDGAGSVRRFETVSRTPGLQFYMGNDSFNGVRLATHLDVMPGNPGTIAVNRSNSSVTVFDDGIPRAQTIPNAGPLKFGSSTSLFVLSGGLRKVAVSSAGLTLVNNTLVYGSAKTIAYANGLVYLSNGVVIDPEAQRIKGIFGGLGFDGLGSQALMAVDAPNGRVFFLNQVNSNWVLRSFDINTFVPIASTTIFGVVGNPSSLVRWGTNGLAFRAGNQVFLIQTSLVSSADPIPAATPTPSPTPSPSPAYFPTFVRRLDLPANDLAYSQSTSSLYASVPSSAGPTGNSITRILPGPGTVASSVFIGSEPGRLALSDDGQTLYANLNGANAIRRFDVPTETPGPQFSSSPQPVDMDVLPGTPNSLAVSRGINGFGAQATIYDNGVARPKSAGGGGGYYAIGPIEFGASASTLYGYDSFSSGFELVKFSVDATGLTTESVTNNLLSGFVNGLKYHNGRLYSGSGRVVDPEAKQLLGTFQGTGSAHALAVDAVNGRVFFLSNTGGSSTVLNAYDMNTFVLLGSFPLNVVGNPVRLIRWGTNGLAFNTVTSGSSDPTSSRIYLLQSALVSPTEAVPTGIQLSSDRYTTFESAGNLTITITRSGDVSAATTVNYATTDGTATAGSDYTAVSSSVTFAPGELSKNFTIPILNDNFYEGQNEAFNVTLSGPTGGAVLSTPSNAVVTINESQSKPYVSGFGGSVVEGNSGTTNATFTITLSNATFQTVTVDYTTANGTATAGEDYVAKSGTVTFDPGTTSKTVTVEINGDLTDEPTETVLLNLSSGTNVSFISSAQLTTQILNDDGPPSLSFATATVTVVEGVGQATINVVRAGRSTNQVTVDYATLDSSGRQNRDYTVATGTLVFAPGQTSKAFRVLINDDAYVEGTESVILVLSNPQGDGATLGTPNIGTLFIQNNDFIGSLNNPIDDAGFFVRAHYSDFLGRAPDDEGLAYWTSQITQCGTDANCIRDRRVAVSNAFFYEQEYQQTASYVFLLYRAAYGDNQPSPNPDSNVNEAKKLPRYLTFVRDRAQVVGGSNLAQSQLTLANAFVQRPEFLAKYPAGLSAEAFVDAVLATIQTADGAVLTTLDRNTLVAHLNTGGRGMVMFHLANDYFNGCERLPGSPSAPCVPSGYGTPVDNRPFLDAEYTRSFVYSQYSGYLRRDAEMGGFLFWLNEVNKAAPRDASVQRAMVCSFLTSAEYQQRFNSPVTRTNADCP